MGLVWRVELRARLSMLMIEWLIAQATRRESYVLTEQQFATVDEALFLAFTGRFAQGLGNADVALVSFSEMFRDGLIPIAA